MKFQWRKPCDCGNCDTRRTRLEIGPFSITHFIDFDDWFVYVNWRKRFWRFSSAGYISGVGK